MNETHLAQGHDLLRTLAAPNDTGIAEKLNDAAPGLGDIVASFVYGEIYHRQGLDLRHRQMATVAALAALGNAPSQLRFHIGAALNAGCSATELVELMLHLAIYAGFPAALNGIFATRDVFAARGLLPVPATEQPAWRSPAERHAAGLEALQRVDGEAGHRVVQSLADIAPDLARFVIDFSFGEIYTRGGLDLLSREIVTVAALAAMGTAVPQLRVHIHAALNVGATRIQLTETAIHLAAYAGFPAAINAALAMNEVFAEHAGHH